MIGAMQHSAVLAVEKDPANQTMKDQIDNYCTTLRTAIHNTFRYGQGTRDMSGASGYTTEDFIGKVAWRLQRYLQQQYEESPPPLLKQPDRKYRRNYDIDEIALHEMFSKYDTDRSGTIDYEEFKEMLVNMNLAPRIMKDEKE